MLNYFRVCHSYSYIMGIFHIDFDIIYFLVFSGFSQSFLSFTSLQFPFDESKSLSPSVNNLFRGIPFSHEDKIHQDIQESFLLGRGTSGNFA